MMLGPRSRRLLQASYATDYVLRTPTTLLLCTYNEQVHTVVCRVEATKKRASQLRSFLTEQDQLKCTSRQSLLLRGE